MPNTEAAEALVKAYAETPAKLQDKEISITMMTKPVDLNYTVSACTKHYWIAVCGDKKDIINMFMHL